MKRLKNKWLVGVKDLGMEGWMGRAKSKELIRGHAKMMSYNQMEHFADGMMLEQ